MAWLAAYNFDDLGSATIVDRTGNGWDISLTAQPGAQVDSGGLLDDGALAKTGSGTIPLPAGLLAASESDDRTLMFDALGGRAVWWVRWESLALNTGVWGLLSLDGSTVIARARDQGNNGPTPGSITLGTLEASVRHNVAITYKRSTGIVSCYFDGVLIGQSGYAAGTALYVGADALNIAEWSSAGPGMDNLRIADHCADDAEIAALAGTPVAAPAPPAELAATLPILVGLSGAVDPPPATVAQLAAALPLTVSHASLVDAPPATVPTLTAALPVALAVAGDVDVPAATVPAVGAVLPLTLTHGAGVLDDGIKRNTTLTATIEGPKWTATLGGTMADRTINRLSVEHVPVDVADNGTPVTGWRYVILPVWDEPDTTAQFTGIPTELGGKWGVLIGPGTAHVLDPGVHVVWVRYEADPEAPVVEAAGRITITRGATP